MRLYSTWIPNQPASKGATDYHNAVVNTSWHKTNINALINLVKGKIKKDQVVVDYGAGTGSSTIYLFKTFKEARFLVVDNSASWLTKAYEILHKRKNVYFLLLEKQGNRYIELNKLVGKNSADHILSFNTVHLIPGIKEAFGGIHSALKKGGLFAFQSGNIARSNRKDEILMIDDSVRKIHDIALKIIRGDNKFKKYTKRLSSRVKQESRQRKFIFPSPRSIEYYLKTLKSSGFRNVIVTHKRIRVKYKDWLSFLKVRRLQAGILPEIGGKDPAPQEEQDRDTLITRASREYFKRLESQNSFANSKSFTAEWIYVQAEK